MDDVHTRVGGGRRIDGGSGENLKERKSERLGEEGQRREMDRKTGE